MSDAMGIATSRVITALSLALEPVQRQEVAAELRSFEGDHIDRKFFATVAEALERYDAFESSAVSSESDTAERPGAGGQHGAGATTSGRAA